MKIVRWTMEDIARQALSVMALDLEYSNELPATYGHVPMRHSILWGMIEDILGADKMAKHIADCEREVAEGHNEPVKTNPQLAELGSHEC